MPSHCCTASGFDGNHRKAPPSFWTAASTAPDGSHPTKIVVALAGSCTRYTVWPSSLSTLSICDESTSAIIRARAFHAQCTAPPAPAGTSVSKPLTGTDASSDSLGRRSGAGPADDSITPILPDDDCDVGGGGVGAASNADMKSGSSLPPLFREREPPFPDIRLPASCGEPETRRDRFPARARAKRLLYCDARSAGEPSPETSIFAQGVPARLRSRVRRLLGSRARHARRGTTGLPTYNRVGFQPSTARGGPEKAQQLRIKEQSTREQRFTPRPHRPAEEP